MLTRASSVTNNNITTNINKILEKISPSNVMAVVKYASDSDIYKLLEDGRIRIVGENKIQDAIKRWGENGKFSKYRDKVTIHYIGHLQKNKVKYAVKLFDYIDSIDSIELANEINKKTSKKIPVLIQLKINNKESQYGIMPYEFDSFINELFKFPNISPAGIMAIGPITKDEEEIRKSFKIARDIFIKYFNYENNKDGFKTYLSLGMSSDWNYAIEEGSNLVRLGNIIFSTSQ
ncbi:MAG: YggS family pyridoxal phosphate-dependent enzyme [Elusimicrobiales bacterium]|nr:YggS family pyridoxal phosphate-dependent enzyme [Elusimicrobiales bacterium]